MPRLGLANNSDDSGFDSGPESGADTGPRSNSPSILPSLRSRPTSHHRALDGNDFTSFPTILDPEQEHRSFSTIFSDTLRSVTASALSTPSKRNPPADARSVLLRDSSLSPLRSKRPPAAPMSPSPPARDDNAKDSIKAAPVESMPLRPTASKESSAAVQLIHEPTLLLVNAHPLRLATAPPSVATVHASRPILDMSLDAAPPSHNDSNHRTSQIPSTFALEKSLHSKLSAVFNNLPNDIILSDDSASDSEYHDTLLHTSPLKPTQSPYVDSHKNALAASSVLGSATTPALHTQMRPQQLMRESSPMGDSIVDFSRYSGSVAFPSKIKASCHPPPSTAENPARSSLSALQQQSKFAHKGPRFPAALLGNAKHLLQTNLYEAVSSSASSIIGTEKRRHKKPVKASHNPLKNGGIPKKYWMNDSFVSDCLNCFRPFTAFRRKHHCRFCGQIFCSDCTVFISYDQHRHEKRTRESSAKAHRHRYQDKLRVCKPCYSDVIVYLSDDSLTSDSDEGGAAATAHTLDQSLTTGSVPQRSLTPSSHSFDRARTLLIGSQHQLLCAPLKKSTPTDSPDQGELLPATPSQGAPLSIAQMFLNEAKSPHTKTVPQMAIPATRAGLAVEIPVLRTPLATNQLPLVLLTPKHFAGSHLSSVASTNALLLSGLARRWNTRNPILPSVVIQKPLSNMGSWANSAWSKQRRHQPFADIGFLGGDASHYRQASSASLRSPGDPKFLVYISEEGSSDLDTNGDNDANNGGQANVVGSFRSDLDTEDEQVMSLYSSLHVSNQRVGSRKLDGKSQSMHIVPTLGEFPTISFNNHGVPLKYNVSWAAGTEAASNNMPPYNSITGLPRPDIPVEVAVQAELLRARARANASLERIRSKRRTRQSRMGSTKRSVSGTNMKMNRVGSPLFMNAVMSLDSFHAPESSPLTPSLQSLARSILEDNDTSPGNGLLPIINSEYTTGLAGSSQNILHTDSGWAPLVTMNMTYNELFDDLIIQTLTDCDILDSQRQWADALKLLLAPIQEVSVTDTLDIRQYVKIKCVPGGRIEDIASFAGTFMTQNIDSRRMELVIDNPKIALLTFPIDYLKQKDQFISLRIIHSQQQVYLTNLVSRLVSLEPDVVVVGDSVCGIARSLLEEAGVTVLSNTKPQNIERISRYTNADIFQSVNDLFFKKGTLGTCERFHVEKRVYEGTVKTFTYFDGTIQDRGFTIALRGAGPDVLLSVKYAAEIVLPGFLSSRFEMGYFEDSLLKMERAPENPHNVRIEQLFSELEAWSGPGPEDCGAMLSETEVTGYLEFFRKRHLSLSPSVRFPYPRKLAKVVTSYVEYLRFFREYEQVKHTTTVAEIPPLLMNSVGLTFEGCRLPKGDVDICNAVRYAAEFHLKGLLCEYQFRSRIWSQAIGLPCYQLYPSFHRSIHVLHSTVSIKYATPCAGPNHLMVDYYTENDKALGSFLDEIFESAGDICQECGEKMIDHYKTYVNGHAKIDVVVERIGDITEGDDHEGRHQRVVWSSCKECNFATPVLPMSDDAYHLSFGKFLELCFYGGGVSPRGDACCHDYFKFHNKYYGLNDMVIRMEYSHIRNYHVELPKKQMELHPAVDIKLKLEAFKNIELKADKLFASVLTRLNRVKIDTVDKVDEGLGKIKEMKEKVEVQKAHFRHKTLEVYESTEPVSHLCLNGILRELQELAVAWDIEFNEFEARFLPSENEITRLTQFHLRNFLMDKAHDSESIKEKSSAVESAIDLASMKSMSAANESNQDGQSPGEGKPQDSETATLLMPSQPRSSITSLTAAQPSNQSSFIMDRISRIEAFLESERSASASDKARLVLAQSDDGSATGAPSVAGRDPDPRNKVVRLANLYNKMNIDNISLEFKKQRQEELQRKSHTYRAFPIVESKPVVEIYRNIEDVVNGNDEFLATKKGETIAKDKTSSDDASNATETEADASAQNVAATNMGKSMDIPQPEKTSLLKSLTNFWADRSATLWDSLEYPLESHEHTFADSNVIVREDEPSSLVAFCLSSNDYKQKIKSMGTETGANDGLQFDVKDTEPNIQKIENFAKIQKKFKKRSTYEELTSVERTMNKVTSNHLKYQFSDNNTTFSCKIFYSEQFEAFREACGINDSFIQSLSRCVKWNSSGGKSGLHFLKTLDDRYILKELSKAELDLFVSIAPFYFRYGAQSVFNSLTSAIAKIYGFYQIQVKNNLTGKLYKMDFLSMENLFCNHSPTRIFDLKGSMRNRHVQQTGEENEVLLDENMIEYIYELPVFVNEQLKKLLRGSLLNDTSFLLAMDVMDYSLVVGIDDTSRKLYIGIIDWLRAFTWDKRVENWVKGNNLMTRRGARKGKDPTIVTPKQYKTRFREAMERYLLEVPDIWYEGGDR